MKTLKLINAHWEEYLMKERVKILVTSQPSVLKFLENIKISDVNWSSSRKTSCRIIFTVKNQEFQFSDGRFNYSNRDKFPESFSNDDITFIIHIITNAQLEQFIEFLAIDKKHYIRSLGAEKK